jgi:hypothetical protein
MKKILMILSFIALAAIVAAPVLFYGEVISLDANKVILNTATAVWFMTALCWMGRKHCRS